MSKKPRREYGEGMLDVGTAEMDASVVPTPWFCFRTTEKHPWRGVTERSVLHSTGRKSTAYTRGNESIKRSMLCVAIFHFSRLLGHYRSAVYQ